MSEGRLFVFTAPSGAGKTSLVRALLAREERLAVSVSHTTRPRRPAERGGADYHFVAAAEFAAMVRRGEFLEHAEVFGHRYGTARAEVARLRAAGRDVILEIDWQGARAVRRQAPEAIGVFILPPSLDALAARLRGRGSDAEDVIARRLAQARADILHCREFAHCVVNDDFEATAERLRALLRDPAGWTDPDSRPCPERVAGMDGAA